jgi:drug/metabolite transporter (DMT)-like permease
MQTDIRFPIGLLFTIVGVLITVYGVFTRGAEMYQRSLGININIWAGICLTVFGAAMLVFAIRAQSRERRAVTGK